MAGDDEARIWMGCVSPDVKGVPSFYDSSGVDSVPQVTVVGSSTGSASNCTISGPGFTQTQPQLAPFLAQVFVGISGRHKHVWRLFIFHGLLPASLD